MGHCDIGLIGLAVMGQNLALNMARNGFGVAVFNRSWSRTAMFMEGLGSEKGITPARTLQELAGRLHRPRLILTMVQAGGAVDEIIGQLVPYLERGDVILDGGNSFFRDSERRSHELGEKGVQFLGVGISGGEEGALWGPSIMPGGDAQAYVLAEPILTAISAKVDGEPCVTYIGPGGSGHFVKMVHNGIEYADMQLISEAYDILHRGMGLRAPELQRVFKDWNEGVLSSYLMEITTEILSWVDEETGQPLVDVILDEAEQKGTGRWTTQSAAELGVPIPTIDAAVEARLLSSLKRERVAAGALLSGPSVPFTGDREGLIEAMGRALYASRICAYAQGFALLRAASGEYRYGLDLGEIARIWTGGCIIRARLLKEVRAAYQKVPELVNLLVAPHLMEAVAARQDSWRRALKGAIEMGIPVPAMGASLAYFDMYRTARLPANLTQAQRDYFGAHTYRRVDREGIFHTQWKRRGS